MAEWLINIIKKCPRIAKDTYLLGREKDILEVMIVNEDTGEMSYQRKFIYESTKGEYIRANDRNGSYVRVYMDAK
jgi:hypothetical protein